MIPFYSLHVVKQYSPFLGCQIDLPFRILLLSDGSLTRHLQIFLGSSIQIQILRTGIAQLTDYHGNFIYSQIHYPQISRQTCLVTEKNVKVVYANSIWNKDILQKYCTNPNIPIGNWLIESELDIFRYLYKIEYIYSSHLEEYFDCEGPFWSRYYFLIHNGNILASIQEVFSSRLKI
uniref:hypothetical protein n=1 Tax=Stylonema alsidii TaxID=35155 RepID=UPI001FCDCCCF|nr:hypothetical protein MW559_pgp044 [Stylonema alsidii]UNJ15248.1 hypothetical protein [Stylonema alsidii]